MVTHAVTIEINCQTSDEYEIWHSQCANAIDKGFIFITEDPEQKKIVIKYEADL